ncbi:unnamed protein product [Paramecium primaurelia]|uniref:Uncharacterized protein n=1 Tax=Paramecium primaurelia TaxID=5886 RepID=A0A8S1PI56_PARPR|nr:unnamed protein product [Paramecium primaurelia]
MDVPINNFKGVMLCNRPNENVMIIKEKPFCSRVQPYDQWGLTKKYEETKVLPAPMNPVLERHKKWLEEFKLQNQLKKHAKEEQQVREDEKFERVRELAKKDREITKKMKEEYKQINDIIKKELQDDGPKSKTVQLTAENLKKLEERDTIKQQEVKTDNKLDIKQGDHKKRYKTKPVWAMTKEEEEEHIKQEEDELLNFVENLDYDSYINDLEVNVMLKALQQRVSDIKKEGNWKEKLEQGEKKQEQRELDIYDKISQSLGKNDEARSVHSEKTQNSINQLRKRQELIEQGKQDWEKTTTNGEQKASLEDRIAKHVADEILNQYKNISNVHSNSSIRKILEREAKKTLQEQSIPGPVISVIKNEKMPRDPNTLPYLHRNPAI